MVPARRAIQPRTKTAMLPGISRRPIFISLALAPIATQDVANGSLRLSERRVSFFRFLARGSQQPLDSYCGIASGRSVPLGENSGWWMSEHNFIGAERQGFRGTGRPARSTRTSDDSITTPTPLFTAAPEPMLHATVLMDWPSSFAPQRQSKDVKDRCHNRRRRVRRRIRQARVRRRTIVARPGQARRRGRGGAQLRGAVASDPDRRRGRRGRRGGCGSCGTGARTDRRLGERGDGHRIRAGPRIDAGGISARHGRDLSWTGVWHDGGAQANARAKSRLDSECGFGARLSLGAAAIGLLRRQVRNPGVHRFSSFGTLP